LKRIAVLPSLMIPLLPHKSIYTNPDKAAEATGPRRYENQ
jgi:hypothetical protein